MNGFSETTDGYDERDYQIAELVDLAEHLSTFLSASYPKDDIETALDRADAVIRRYRPAT